ncbi:starch-binding domain-containing protein 1 [Loxodonta africana]|uniref:starch-binding domain-containing protein 1 n=1 Tax=Loxodonta africana TaxID=9785 RepID=UPI0000E34936|nr:starch-binding domain-containing protein 1 [Loxodonta africana]
MGAFWSALLVGGSLAGMLFVWLLRDGPGDTGNEGAAEPKDAPPGETAGPGGDQGGGERLSPVPFGLEPVTKPDHLQESNGRLISETKGLGNLDNMQEAAQRLQSPSGEDSDCDNSRQHVPSGQSPDTKSLATSETGHCRDYSDVSSNVSLDPKGECGFHKGQETSAKAATCFAEKLPSSNLPMDRTKEVSHPQLDSSELANQDWEMVSRHSSWGDVGLGGSLEALLPSPSQGMDYGRSVLVESRVQEVDVKTKKVVEVFPEPQQVSITFQVHYITSTGEQFIAVTGDHESLGRWNTYIPLQYSKDGFWSHSVSLPANTVVQWKFVVVENGEVIRWEECSDRFLETGHEDKVVQEWWGSH